MCSVRSARMYYNFMVSYFFEVKYNEAHNARLPCESNKSGRNEISEKWRFASVANYDAQNVRSGIKFCHTKIEAHFEWEIE